MRTGKPEFYEGELLFVRLKTTSQSTVLMELNLKASRREMYLSLNIESLKFRDNLTSLSYILRRKITVKKRYKRNMLVTCLN